MEKRKEGLKEIINKIKRNEILLPDFQRNYVWDEEKQKRMVASVLAQMPIGSILLLKGEAKDYAYKMMGSRERRKNQELQIADDKEIMALLDGQQRMTTLTNVFSDMIFKNVENRNSINRKLKKRFFLAIPKYYVKDSGKENFGADKLQFPDWTNSEVDILSTDIIDNIVVRSFNFGDNKFYNPFSQDRYTNNEKFDECNTEKEYLIPLYLLIDTEDEDNNLCLDKILKGIMQRFVSDICDEYDELQTQAQKDIFVLEKTRSFYREEHDTIDEIKFQSIITEQGEKWKTDMMNYLHNCLQNIQLEQIIVEKSNRARAINIYENLNLGGISLGTFELVMAKAASESTENYYDRLVSNMQQKGEYHKSLFTTGMQNKSSYVDFIIKKEYVATVQLKAIDKKKDEIVKSYIDAYLNTLCLMNNFKEYNVEELKVDYIKKKKILELEANVLNGLCEDTCKALDRALFFFQMRCGIRNIKDIHYSLMLVAVAYIFSNKEWYEDKQVHDCLEAWYWTSIFSGYYNSDQNTNVIKDIKLLVTAIKMDGDYEFLRKRKNEMFQMKNFCTKDFLLMKDASKTGDYPKEFMQDVICQYYLAETYKGLFDEELDMNPFMSEPLEKHHVIPLGASNVLVKDSTDKLRKEKKHQLNSPFNFIYLTPKENKIISNKPLDSYQKEISTKSSISNLSFSSYKSNALFVDKEEEIAKILEDRFNDFEGKLDAKLAKLIPSS